MRLPVNHALPLAALIFLTTVPATAKSNPPSPPISGPAADYPVVVGEPFAISGTTWTPEDQLNYDAVGYAQVGEGGGAGITAAHKTLPLPSYAEVTALDSGRTILVRITRRGPMTNDALMELSADAATQLGIAAGAHSAVRVRRVNPPEAERALLRSGGRAPERMATPDGLLKVLRRKLADQSPLLPPPSTPPTMPRSPTSALAAVPAAAAPVPKPPIPTIEPKPIAPVVAAPKPAPKPITKPTAAAPAKGTQVVQVGTFSVEANARKAASGLGAQVTPAGKFWRVHLGPFANGAQAAAALEKARAAGYSDARISRTD
ncbi:rare lipoprotein A [Novosphingobium sp. PhB165]|uniref:SPOR domain-containing protein n=1 Tax=Novosphingobium sp. PhB165 TaxID=2485105 RepID=UPI001042A98A|nr:RlpA-like double-psi beta-barrel domain-containing protein [Novosphingobium sp. PhB165]TCM22123.1 rare lipoprotein A [Novosphingobium sp. PhB165]